MDLSPYYNPLYEARTRSNCTVEEILCMSRVVLEKMIGIHVHTFYGYKKGLVHSDWHLENGLRKYIGGVLCEKCFPQDMGLYNTRYHRSFFSKKKANRYVELVKSGCAI